jgi:hypothetical protein
MASCKKNCGERKKCCELLWNRAILNVLGTLSDPTGSFGQPSGPATDTVVPHIYADADVTVAQWNGTVWTDGLAAPPDSVTNYSLSFVAPSTIAPVFGAVTPGVVAQAWVVNPQVSTLINGMFVIAGVIGTVPTVVVYSSTLNTLSTTVLPGVPSVLAYNGNYVVVAGTVSAGVYYLAVYGMGIGGALTQISLYNYGVPVTSLSITTVDGATSGVTRTHVILLVTTQGFYLPGEIIGYPNPVLTLATAPPGDLFIYELLPLLSPVYTTQPPVLLFSYRYGGLLSASYSRRKNVIFALNYGSTVVSFSAIWRSDGLSVAPSSYSSYAPGAAGVYVVDGVGFTNLIVYGAGEVVAYNVMTVPA